MWDATTGREASRLDDKAGLALDVLSLASAPLCKQGPPAAQSRLGIRRATAGGDDAVKIYLVRHGEAVPEEMPAAIAIAGSPRGREAARVLGRLLREHSVEPDAIVCSPLPRAVQTAELLAQSLDYLGVIASLRSLEPSAQPRVAATEIMRPVAR